MNCLQKLVHITMTELTRRSWKVATTQVTYHIWSIILRMVVRILPRCERRQSGRNSTSKNGKIDCGYRSTRCLSPFFPLLEARFTEEIRQLASICTWRSQSRF